MAVNKTLYDGLPFVINIFILFAFILFFTALFGFIFGGDISLLQLFMILSMIGYGFLVRRKIKKIINKEVYHPYQYAIDIFYHIGCMFLWFPTIIAILFSILGIIGTIADYRKRC